MGATSCNSPRSEGSSQEPRVGPPMGNGLPSTVVPKRIARSMSSMPKGRNMHAITSGDYDNSVPSWSRDGQWIYFGSMRTGEWQLWKQKPEGGGPVQVTQHGGFTAFESYDGKTVYYSKRDGEGIWSIPVAGGAETRVTAAPRLGNWGNFAVSETGLYLLDDDVMPRPTIEFYNFQTRKLTPVIRLEHSGHAWAPGLDASRDGRTVLFVQWEPQASIAMVENFQ